MGQACGSLGTCIGPSVSTIFVQDRRGCSTPTQHAHVHANLQAHWRGIVARRYVQELRRERAAHKIADAWLTFTMRRNFLDLRRCPPPPPDPVHHGLCPCRVILFFYHPVLLSSAISLAASPNGALFLALLHLWISQPPVDNNEGADFACIWLWESLNPCSRAAVSDAGSGAMDIKLFVLYSPLLGIGSVHASCQDPTCACWMAIACYLITQQKHTPGQPG